MRACIRRGPGREPSRADCKPIWPAYPANAFAAVCFGGPVAGGARRLFDNRGLAARRGRRPV
eukprot:7238391-Lingulodinium_polyedra.AAC.1